NEFAARIGIAGAPGWPQIGYGAGATRNWLSRETAPGSVAGIDRSNDSFEAALNLSWELDLWGRIRQAKAAAEGDFEASIEERNALILSLVSSVAQSYILLLSLDAQLAVAMDSVTARQTTLDLFTLQLEKGVLSELEVAQVRSEFERTRATIPALEREISTLENALSVLLGRAPGRIARGQTLATLSTPSVPPGLPSELLVQRPDIRAAERQLFAANARIGVAMAERFPTISLTGLFGQVSDDLSNLMDSSANFAQVSGGLVGPIFAGGAINAQIEAAEASAQTAALNYEATVLTALREAEDSIVIRSTTVDEADAQERRVEALQDYLHFANMRYDNGYSSYLAVLDAERTLFDAQLLSLQVRAAALSSIIGIYKAFGGGWVEAVQVTETAVQ
ncbi:MAG: efflux transporter outer membrane subunit, partial [Pseudomonadota bacterium]